LAKYRSDGQARQAPVARATIRLDKWLWQARFFRSRPQACEMIAEGHLRLNGNRCLKPGHQVGEGDTLTFPQGGRIRLIRVLAPGLRRGPAHEAVGLYTDLDPQSNPADAENAENRPTSDQDGWNDVSESTAEGRYGNLR
jgi:ribosome-associated heat shock protein Hsp15